MYMQVCVRTHARTHTHIVRTHTNICAHIQKVFTT